MQIIDSGEAVARQTKAVLTKYKLLNIDLVNGTHQFYINKIKDVLETLLPKENINLKIDEKDF